MALCPPAQMDQAGGRIGEGALPGQSGFQLRRQILLQHAAIGVIQQVASQVAGGVGKGELWFRWKVMLFSHFRRPHLDIFQSTHPLRPTRFIPGRR